MKNLKHVIFIPLFFLTATMLFAETSGGKDSSSVSSINVEKKSAEDDDELKHIEFGIRYMPTFSSIDMNSSNGVVEGSFTMSNGFGGMLGINFTQNLGIQGEINYYQINQKYADGSLNRDLTINYLNIPVLLSLNTNKAAPVNLNFVAGPQFGINVGSNLETSGSNGSDTAKAVVALKKGDVGVAYGAGLEFALNKSHSFRLDLGFRGFYGLVNMDSSTNQDGTYNVIVSASRKTYGGYVGLAWMF
ncbi:MAG: porin family protein [Cytophaga sp.]|uniref:porin family protein n=1 Tax=Cytophaga sp. TaxID=29535 RepID=UPI003F7F7727